MPTPQIISHPVTGQKIDVAPLFAAMNSFDAQPNAPLSEGACDAIRRIIRVLNLTQQDPALNPPAIMVDVYQDLHRLEDMFKAITGNTTA